MIGSTWLIFQDIQPSQWSDTERRGYLKLTTKLAVTHLILFQPERRVALERVNKSGQNIVFFSSIQIGKFKRKWFVRILEVEKEAPKINELKVLSP